MPHREPKSKLKDRGRLSVAIMERVGAAMRKDPPKDLDRACQIMKEERDDFLNPKTVKYAKERQGMKNPNAERMILMIIAANAVARILEHEGTLAPAAPPPPAEGTVLFTLPPPPAP